MSKSSSPELSKFFAGQINLSDPVSIALLYARPEIDPSPGQAQYMRDICDPSIMQLIAKVHRGAGKTICAAISFATLHRLDPTWRIFVHSGSFSQARYLYNYYRPMILDPEFMPQDWIVDEPTQSLTQFKQGGSMEILTASERRSRGGHVDILCLDEAVLIPKNLIDAALPVVRTSKRPKRIVMSTASPKVSLAWFLHIWQNAEELGFKRYEWPPEECHWLHGKEAEFAKKLVDSETYKIEWLGEIAERKGRVWDPELIRKALVDIRKVEVYPRPSKPDVTEWSLGLDWGFIHPTVITVWEKQGETLYARDCRIRPETALLDIMQEIKEDFPRVPVYADASGVHENDQLQKMGVKVTSVNFGKDKDALIGHVRWRLEKGLIKIPDPNPPNPDPDTLAECRKYYTLVEQMLAYSYDEKGKPRKVNDDAVDSMLCAMKPFLHPPSPPSLFVLPRLPPFYPSPYYRDEGRERFMQKPRKE